MILILRFIVVLLTSAGLAYPASAFSPCRCAQRDDCCSQRAVDSSNCCKPLKPCCARREKENQRGIEVACYGPAACDYCSCCSRPPSSAIPSAHSVTILTEWNGLFSSVALLPTQPGPVAEELSYLAHERAIPPGHPDLRVHALKCVWLN